MHVNLVWRSTGRNFLRCVEGRTDSNLNITVINDSGTCCFLLQSFMTACPCTS